MCPAISSPLSSCKNCPASRIVISGSLAADGMSHGPKDFSPPAVIGSLSENVDQDRLRSTTCSASAVRRMCRQRLGLLADRHQERKLERAAL